MLGSFRLRRYKQRRIAIWHVFGVQDSVGGILFQFGFFRFRSASTLFDDVQPPEQLAGTV